MVGGRETGGGRWELGSSFGEQNGIEWELELEPYRKQSQIVYVPSRSNLAAVTKHQKVSEKENPVGKANPIPVADMKKKNNILYSSCVKVMANVQNAVHRLKNRPEDALSTRSLSLSRSLSCVPAQGVLGTIGKR